MFQSMITIIKAPFVSTPIHIIVGIKFKPKIPRGTKLVSLHEDMPKEVNKIFANHPSNLAKGNSDPPGPPRYFGLPMINIGKPPFPPNRPCCRLLNYPEYVKDSNPNVHFKVFKVAIRAKSETNDVKIVSLLSFTFRDIMSN